mgnify:FL=1
MPRPELQQFMKNYLRILRYAGPYRRLIVLATIFNVLMVLFSQASITVLIPILKIIFQNTREVSEVVPLTSITELRVHLESLLNYQFTIWMERPGRQQVLLWTLAFAAGMFLLKNLFRYLGAIFIIALRNAIERDLRNDIHYRVLHLPLQFFSEKRKGDIAARMTTDVLEIQWAILSTVKRLVEAPLMILITLGLMLVLSPQLTFFVILLIPITGFIITSIGNILKKPSEDAKKELGKLMSLIDENIAGLAIVKSYVAENYAQSSFRQSNQRYYEYMNQLEYRRELSSPISEVLGSLVILIIIWFGSTLILDQQALEPEVFITFIALFYQIINPAKAISVAIYDIKRGDASAQRVMQLIDSVNPLADRPDAQPLLAFKEAIRFEAVRFRYAEKEVLRGLSFTVKKGQTVALVGQSGSGKSTLAYLLNRFYDVVGGQIEIDGTDIRDLRLADLRSHIGYISQDAVLFHDTVRNNLLFGNEGASEADLIRAAKVANAHEFIEKLERGYDTNIGDDGQKLSGGQRQRLTIARAVLKNPPLLILDEATSALDSESEKLVQEALLKVMANRTSIVIAHRLSTIQHADEIIVLNEGEIVERGQHEALLSRGGAYQKLVSLQSF